MLVCVRILVRLAASDQTDPGPGRGKINLVGEREQNVKNVQQKGMKGERERRRGGGGTGGLQKPSPQTHPPGPTFLPGQARPSAVTAIARIARRR